MAEKKLDRKRCGTVGISTYLVYRLVLMSICFSIVEGCKVSQVRTWPLVHIVQKEYIQES
jgi:hypothetical protein